MHSALEIGRFVCLNFDIFESSRLDLLKKLLNNTIFDLEVQSSNDKDMIYRMPYLNY